jgi:hypothetical protein
MWGFLVRIGSGAGRYEHNLSRRMREQKAVAVVCYLNRRSIMQRITLAIFLVTTFLTSCGQTTNSEHGKVANSPNDTTGSIEVGWHLTKESAGIDNIAAALISVFDHADIVALGESHGHFTMDLDLWKSMVRNSAFRKKVRFIMVEFGSTTEQSTLDRYIRGENVSKAQLEQVWKTTTQASNGVWDSPIYMEFFAAVREANSKLPADSQIRVLGGDPGPGDNRSREVAAVSVLKEQVLEKRNKALVIYGASHFYRRLPQEYLSSMGDDIGLVRRMDRDFPGRIFVVIPIGRLNRPSAVKKEDMVPNLKKFDTALKTHLRPVMISLQRLPFRDFTAEEFLGRTLTTCRGANGCVSVFKGSPITLGEMADACIYIGGQEKDTN